MGCWNHTCGLTSLPIYWGIPVVALPVLDGPDGVCPAGLPIRGTYNDYGLIEDDQMLQSPQWEVFLELAKPFAIRQAIKGFRRHFKDEVTRRTEKGVDKFEAVLSALRYFHEFDYYRKDLRNGVAAAKSKNINEFWDEFRGLTVPDNVMAHLMGGPRDYHLDFLLFHEKAWDEMVRQGRESLVGNVPSWCEGNKVKVLALEAGDIYGGIFGESNLERYRARAEAMEMTLEEYLLEFSPFEADRCPLFWPWTYGGGETPTHACWSPEFRDAIYKKFTEGNQEWTKPALELMYVTQGMREHRKTFHSVAGTGSQEDLTDGAEKWLDTQTDIVKGLRYWREERDEE